MHVRPPAWSRATTPDKASEGKRGTGRDGELPIEISREGFKYQYREVTGETDAAFKDLEATLATQSDSIKQLESALKRIVGMTESLNRRVALLESRSKEGSTN